MDSGHFASSGRDRRARYGWLSGVLALYAAAFLLYAEK
jgi:hypothetical protein